MSSGLEDIVARSCFTAAVHRRQEKVTGASHVGKGSVGLTCPAHDLYDRARVKKQVRNTLQSEAAGYIIYKYSGVHKVEMRHDFFFLVFKNTKKKML